MKNFFGSAKDILITVLGKLDQYANHTWVAYLSILLLQLKRIWGIWKYKDLTFGDTSYYFMDAYGWVDELSVKIQWSPLYTAYYGTIYRLIPDAYWATIFHRIVIVLALALLILAVMRYLLPAPIALLITVWWVVLPINFNSLYEVHLFAVILPLITTLFVLYKPNIWMRGIALGILLVCMMLVRNETIIALNFWVLSCFVWEIREIKLKRGEKIKTYVFAYGIPVLMAALIFSFFYWRTLNKPSPESLKIKHTLNVCQIYSFGYQQRYSDWQKSAWTECSELMLRDFGQEFPNMMEAIRSNPNAMFEHFLWNIRLFPAGLQVALFNATSDNVNPDYTPVLMNQLIILIPSGIALILLILGSILFLRERKYWWSFWIEERLWGWLMLFCLSATMLIVIPMQRPRPSYMFLMTLFVMAVLGMCFFVLIHRHTIYRYFSKLALISVMLLIFFMPSFFSMGERPVLNLYRRLTPLQEFVGVPGTAIVTSHYSQELCNYFTKSGNGGCIGHTYTIFQQLDRNITINEILKEQPVPITLVYLDESFFKMYSSNPSVQAFLANPEKTGWRLAAMQNTSTGIWQIYINTNVNISP